MSTYVKNVLADLIAKNRKILEDVQYQVRKLQYGIKDEESDK